MDDRDGSRPSFKLSDRGLPFLQSGGVAGPDKKAYLKSRNNDQAIVVVLHSSVSIQFSAPTCRTHTYLCRHISTPSKFGVILCLCGAVEREIFFWSREFGHVRLGLAHLTTLVLADVVLDFDGLLMTRWASNSQGSILPDRYLIVRRFRSLSVMDLDLPGTISQVSQVLSSHTSAWCPCSDSARVSLLSDQALRPCQCP